MSVSRGTAEVSFDHFRQEWLADVLTGEPSTVEKGRRFARKLLTQWREIDEAADDLVYCDGSGDGGIDIAYLYRGQEGDADGEATVEGDRWYLAQSKFGSAFRGTPSLLEEGQKVIDTLSGQRRRLSSLAEGLLERLNTFMRQASEHDRIVLVFATEQALTDEEKRALQGVRAMGRERLGSIFDVESVSVSTIYQRMLEETAAAVSPGVEISVRAALVPSGDDLLVGSISLLSLYELLKAYRAQTEDLDQLYEKNVRRFLGPGGRVNRAIQETLRRSPERFGLYNTCTTTESLLSSRTFAWKIMVQRYWSIPTW